VSQGELLGRIVLRDDIRPEAQRVVEQLRQEGLRTVVLTGDRQSAAEHLKARLGLDDIRAELKPDAKSVRDPGVDQRGTPRRYGR